MGTPYAAVDLPSPSEGQYKLQSSKRDLLDLPAEIRNSIYRYVFEGAYIQHEFRMAPGTSYGHEILLASKTYYQEAKAMFYKSATIRIENFWGAIRGTGTFNTNILQHVEQVVIHTSGQLYHLPEILQDMRSLKRIEIDHPQDWQEFYPEDGIRATDDELSNCFQSYFDPVPVGDPSALLAALREKNVEVCVPVTFLLPCRHGFGHGREIYCEFNASGSMRRMKEVKLPVDEMMDCYCDICKTKAMFWFMIRLRWISIINKRLRRSEFEAGDASKAIFKAAEGC